MISYKRKDLLPAIEPEVAKLQVNGQVGLNATCPFRFRAYKVVASVSSRNILERINPKLPKMTQNVYVKGLLHGVVGSLSAMTIEKYAENIPWTAFSSMWYARHVALYAISEIQPLI